MPKNKFQEVIFTIIMVFFMFYAMICPNASTESEESTAMICYNIALNKGGMTNEVFLLAFHELVIMGPIAFILDFFLYGHLAKKIAFGIINPAEAKQYEIILAISSVTVCLMCPTMSLAATM